MKKVDRAYIAGFLDGDGSIYIRLKPNRTYKFGFQIAPSIVFYQSQKQLRCIKNIYKLLGVGYIRKRKDGIIEYIIGDIESMLYIIDQLIPYLRLKKKQAVLFKRILRQKACVDNPRKFLLLAKEIDKFEKLNYSKKRKQNSKMVEKFLIKESLLTP